MKKKWACIVTAILLSLTLCACGEKTFDCSISEMNFTVTDNLSEETDKETVIQNFVDSEAVNSAKDFKEIFIDSMWFYNNSYDFTVSARYMPYNNDQLDDCITDAFESGVKDKNSEDIKVGSLTAKRGYYEIEGCKNHFMYILNGGIFYQFEIMLQEGVEYPKNYLENIAESIEFSSEQQGSKKAACGEIQFKIPNNYQESAFDPTEDAYDEQWYAQFDENRIELGIFNLNGIEWGYPNASELLDSIEVDNASRTSEKFDLGICEYLTGTDVNGAYIAAAFEYNNKIYLFQLFGTESAELQYIYPIINSITAK